MAFMCYEEMYGIIYITVKGPKTRYISNLRVNIITHSYNSLDIVLNGCQHNIHQLCDGIL